VNLDDALHELLPPDQTGQEREDLVAAAVEAWRRRHVNTEAGAAVIAALAESGLSYREIARLTGIPAATAHRWARPPEEDVDKA
jgi:DNA-directed RNA polymerase specialized sigma24 family protein